MCGLTGVLSQWLSGQEIETFQQSMVLASLRGRDGAGVVGVSEFKKRDIEVIRTLGSSAELVYSPAFDKSIKSLNRPTLLMGHARFPTRGGLTMADVHPHCVGDILGMHNGTMSVVNGSVIKKDDNDSKLLFECLEKEGLETTVKRAVGDYALCWLNRADWTVNFYRNTKRPLWFATQIGGGGTVWWASEPDFLFLVLERQYGEGTIETFELAPFHHLSFRVRPDGKIKPVKYENIVPGTPPTPKTSVPAVSCNALQTEASSNVQYTTHAGKALYFEELEAALKSGCVTCGNAHTMRDYNLARIVWVDRDEYVCKQCYALDPLATQIVHQYANKDTQH
jgi:hypothetical protein